MLRPNKHSDPALTVLPVAAEVLRLVRAKRIVTIASLRDRIASARPETDRLFIPAIHTLFLLGLLEYRQKRDALEYVGP
jgi:hypothetical protein